MANTRGGSVSNLRTMSPSDREEAFKQASTDGNWIGASLQSPAAFDDIVTAATTTLDGYTSILNTGTKLLEVNVALAIAALNPISAVIGELIDAVQDQINDFMGAGFYVLFIDGQDDGLSAYGIKKTAPVIKIERWKTGGIYIDPFTDTTQFSVQRLMNIENIKDRDKTLGTNVAANYIGNPKKYLIWNGNIFDKESQKPLLELANKKDGSNTLDISLVNKINDWRDGLQSVPPDKMIQIINQSFDDAGDNNRPRFSDSGNVGGLVMIVGATDPTQLFGKIAKLYNFFSTLEPLRKAVDAVKAIRDEAAEFRKQRIKVRNLCAPNKTNNPPKEDWPVDLSNTKSKLQADWNEFKIGTNSDNTLKYQNRNIDIENHKNDKILFKNLRTNQVFQIIKVGPAKEIKTPTTTGTDESQTDPNDVQAIDIITQGTTITYSQEWEALFDTYDPDTLPGDVLVEVEIDDRYLFYDSETEEPEGGENWYDKYNSYCLKNGTKITGENEDIEGYLKLILKNRIRNADSAYVASEDKAWNYYASELNKGSQSKYYDSLRIRRTVTPEEAQRIREKTLKNNWINAGYDENEIPDYSVNNTPQIYELEQELKQVEAERKYIEESGEAVQPELIRQRIKLLNTEVDQYDIKINEITRLATGVEVKIEQKTIQLKEEQNKLDDLQGNFTFSPFTGNYRAKDALNELNDANELVDSLKQEKENLETDIKNTHELQFTTYYRSIYPSYTETQISELVSAEQLVFSNNQEWNTITESIQSAEADVTTKTNAYNSAILTKTGITKWEELKQSVEDLRIELRDEEQRLIETLKPNNDPGTGNIAEKLKRQNEVSKLELLLEDKNEKFNELDARLLSLRNKIQGLRDNIDYNVGNSTISYRRNSFSVYQEITIDDIAVGQITRNFDGTYEPSGDKEWVDKINELMDSDPENQIIEKQVVKADELDELTPEESALVLSKILKNIGLDPNTIDKRMLNFINNKLGGYFYIPNWKGTGPELPAPRFCIVEAVDGLVSATGDINDTKKTPSRYPDWNSYTLEDLIPQLRDVLNLANVFLESLKGMVDGIAETIRKIVKFLKERVIPKIQKLIKQLQEWVDLLKIGIVDAGIFFLYIPPQTGGINNFREKLVSAGNRPTSNLHFTYSFVLLGGGPESAKSFEILDKLIDLT